MQAPQSARDDDQNYFYQVCVSGSINKGPFRGVAEKPTRPTNAERIALIRETAQSFAEPFCSFVSLISDDTAVKQLDLDDWALPDDPPAVSTHTLVGDAAHAMTMCKPPTTRPSITSTQHDCSPRCGRESCHSRCLGTEANGPNET